MTSPPIKTNCLSEEIVAAFVDGRLDREALHRVTQHVAICSPCHDVIIDLIRIRTGHSAWRRLREILRTKRQAWLSTAALAILALVAVWLFPPYGTNFRAHRELRELVRAANDLPYRSLESRLSGGFVHRPVERVMRSSTERMDNASTMRRVVLACVRIEQKAAKHPSVSTLHTLGISQLIRGAVDDALETFAGALQRCAGTRDLTRAIARCENADLLTDLSAGYYERARRRNRPRDLYLAFDGADRAWQVARTPETAWNRALALQALHQRAAARGAWETYRALDSQSPWSAEARMQIARLDPRSDADRWAQARAEIVAAAARNDQRRVDQLVCGFTQSARMWAEEEVFPGWARAHIRGEKTEEGGLLRLARAVSLGIRTCTGAQLLASVSHDMGWLPTRQPARLHLIARGLSDYGDARRLYRAHRIAEAQQFFESADKAFRASHSPFAVMTRLFLASCTYYKNEYDAVIRATTAALAETELQTTSPAAAAQLRWLRGLSFLYTGQPQRALEDFQAAFVVFDRFRESDNAAAMHEMLAYCFDYLGAPEEASRHRLSALEAFGGSDASVPRKATLLVASAKSALLYGAPRAALELINTQLMVMPPPARLDLRVNGLLWRRRIKELLGQQDAAADVQTALALSTHIPDQRMRESALNTVEFVQERIRSSPTSDARMQILTGAIDFATQTSDWFRLSTFYADQAEEYLRSKRDTDAEKALNTAITHFESERTMLTDDELRSTFFEGKARPYEMLTSLYARRGDAGRAFDTMERSRARTLLDGITYVRTSPAFREVRDIQAQLPEGVAIVATSMTPDEILTWIVTYRTFEMRRLPASNATVAELARSYDDALSGDDDSRANVLAGQLYDYLVRPWIGTIDRGASLVIVPDPRLARIPYAALIDKSSGRYLIEGHAIQFAPSVNVFLECLRNDARLRSASSPIALIVAPADETNGSRAPTLAFARREAEAVAGLYGSRATILRGRAATKREFVHGSVNAGTLHFAGHTEPGLRGGDARILLSGGPGGQDNITGDEIRHLVFDRTRVVVLSSCTSARDASGQQGVSSLARAFIAAGVPTVVGSLWPVEDAAASTLLVAFHRHLRNGADAAQALRLAQLATIRERPASPEALRGWAAFIVIGSSIREGDGHG